MNWRIRPLLLFVFAVFFVGIFTVMAIVTYTSVSRIVIQATTESKLELLTETNKQLTSRLGDTEALAVSIASNKLLTDALSEEASQLYPLIEKRRDLNKMINSYLYSRAYVSSIFVYGIHYEDVPSQNGDRVLPLSSFELAEQLKNSDALWSGKRNNPHRQFYDDEVITYVSKIYARSGTFLGYLEINLKPSFLSDVFYDNTPNPRDLLVMDSGGNIVASGNTELFSYEAYRQADWIRQLGTIEAKGYRKIYVGESAYLITFSSPNDIRWRVIEVMSYDKILAQVVQIRNIVLLIGLIGLLVSIVIAVYLSRKITGPISKLLIAFKYLEQGNMDYRLPEAHQISELKRLFISFNHSSERLKNVIESLDDEHKAKREAELKVLQSQINPHFLYNTLDMINWMAAKQGAHDASVMTAKLARLFRISLSKGQPFILLKEELEHGRIYSEIHQKRFKDRLRVVERVNPAIKGMYVPKFIVQPFIENAIIHAFQDFDKQERIIAISGDCNDDGMLSLIIEDNGRGLPANWQDVTHRSHLPSPDGGGGYGIDNVRQRIQLYFGEKYGVQLAKSSLGGVKVVITMRCLQSTEQLEQLLRKGGGTSEYIAGRR